MVDYTPDLPLHIEFRYSMAFATVMCGSLVNYPCIVAIQLQTFSDYLLQGLNITKIQNEWLLKKLIEILLLCMLLTESLAVADLKQFKLQFQGL